MVINGPDLPRHHLSSLLDPSTLLVVADRDLPAWDQLPDTLASASTLIRADDTGQITLPAALKGVSEGSRLDLAVVCLPPDRLAGALDALAPYRPRGVLILRHPAVSPEAAGQTALCRRWGAMNDCLVLGPHSFGVQRPHRRLNLSLDPYRAPAGRVALIAQSSSIMAAVLDWAEDISLGFSALISVNEGSAVDIAEVLDFLSMDGRTSSIVLYLEHAPSSRRFTSAMRAASSVKPVVVLKSGRHPANHEAAVQLAADSHNAVFNALLRRVGAIRVRYFIQLFSALKVLVHTSRPRGRRIAILSNGHAAAQLALDVMGPEAAVFPAELSGGTIKALAPYQGPDIPLRNPVVMASPFTPDTVERLVRQLSEDPGVNGVLVLIAPDPHADLDAVTDRLAEMVNGLRKPLITCFMGDAGMRGLRKRLDRAGAPAFRTPESAVEGFGLLAAYHYSQTLAQQTLAPEPLSWPPRLERARALLQRVRNDERDTLDAAECQELLECFYVPIHYVPDHAYATDQGPAAAGTASEATPMAIRMQLDPRFGPYIAFGAAGRVEWVANSSRAVELPPLNRYLARQLVQRSTLWRRVLSRQLTPAGLELLYESLERISELVSELPTLQSVVIDPLLPGEPLLRASRIQITIKPESLRVLPETTGYRHLAIHPYPRRMVQEIPFDNGDHWLLRPIRPEDAELLQEFVRNLSDESRYMRFVSMLRELTPRMLARYTSIDYDRELALVATVTRPNPEHRGFPKETIIGFAHYLRNADGRGAEYALAISDDWQRRGLGARLMRGLIEAAQAQGLTYIDGYVLANNRPMLALMSYLGFRNDPDPDDPGMRRVWLDLGEGAGVRATPSSSQRLT